MRKYRDKEWLAQEIEHKNKGRVEVAEELDVSHKTIMKYCKRYGVGDDLQKCHSCEKVSPQLGKHWSSSNCGYPSLSDKQRDILTGILMADGSINMASEKNQNPRFRVDMYEPSLPYLEYLSEEIFPVITTSVGEGETAASACERKSSMLENPESISDMYYLSSRRMPIFKEYTEWYTNGHKYWPCEDIDMNPTIFKHLYVGDGNLYEKSGSHFISIAANDQYDVIDEVVNMFNRAGFDPSVVTHSRRESTDVQIRFNKNDTERIFEWMGEPLPGFEYKWPEQYR